MSAPVILRIALASAVVAASGCGKKPDRKTFAEAWQAAVAAKDGAAAWKQLDKASRARIVDGLTRSQAKAAADVKWKELFAAANPGIDATLPAQSLAIAMITPQLGTLAISDDGKTPHVHLEGSAWRARVEPVGFTSEGIPLTMTLRLPAEDPPQPTTMSVQVQLPLNDHVTGARPAPSAREKAYVGAAEHIAEAAKLPPHFAEGAARLMMQFHFGQYGAVEPPLFDFDPLNAFTPHVPVYDENFHYVRKFEYPKVTYGPWPPASAPAAPPAK